MSKRSEEIARQRRQARNEAIQRMARDMALKSAGKEVVSQFVGSQLANQGSALLSGGMNWYKSGGKKILNGNANRADYADSSTVNNNPTGYAASKLTATPTAGQLVTGKWEGQGQRGGIVKGAIGGAQTGSQAGRFIPVIGPVVGGFLGGIYGAAQGAWGGGSRTAQEGDRLKFLQDKGVEIAGLGKNENGVYIEPKDETRSRQEQLDAVSEQDLPDDFVGEYTDKDGQKHWINKKWLASGDEKDLTGKDIAGYSTFYATDPTWLTGHSENYRNSFAQEVIDSGFLNEHEGTIDVDWDKFGAYLQEKYKDAPPDWWEDMDESKLPTYYQDQIKKQEEEQKRKEEEEREKKEREGGATQ